jgi:predicted RNA-binding protein YlxR (DUF448 family)
MRKCIVTNEHWPKKELIRVVRTPDNTVIVDLTGKANGRGAYLKKQLDIIETARKKKILDKHLEIAVPDEIYEELIKNLN